MNKVAKFLFGWMVGPQGDQGPPGLDGESGAGVDRDELRNIVREVVVEEIQNEMAKAARLGRKM